MTDYKRSQRGMTLLEVMVAIFIFALSATAILRSGAEHLRSTGKLKQITFATWAANNRLSEVLLTQPWPIKNNQVGESELANQTWYWRQVVADTMDKDFKQVTIEIALDKELEGIITSVSTYVAKPKPVDI